MFSKHTLVMLDTVARLGSFTQAAQQLHKVPSAISYNVKQVEQDLGVTLFQRLPRRVELTEAGHHFMAEARVMLRQMEELRQQTQRVANGWQHTLRLALDNVVKPLRITALVRDFYRQFDDAELVISMEVFNGVWDALADGRADIAIGATSAIPVGGDFGFRDMGELHWRFVMAPHHPCAQEAVLTHQQLERYPVICLEDSARTLPKRSNWQLDNQRRLMVPDWPNAIACFIEGLGLGCMPSHYADPLINRGLLVERSLPDPRRPSACCLAWRNDDSNALLAWVLDYLGDSEQLNREWLS
ncbi:MULTISPECIES: DNA-binding transcriptional activator PunR [Ferrimonas]|uniref:DNA-binding transcriptional activator PunR n=1 Tax=Ferrimonas TaxID=44011 RepID=UPI0004008EC0|nr:MULTISPECIES: DNA-binding transcriptional activator PunR [Ferrimonas]USD38992.1 LysR family transcriptional regulator [Ferrimonas sp. SCSIO 43195]